MPDTTMNPALAAGANPYDNSGSTPVLPQQSSPFGIFGNPPDPSAEGLFGISKGTWNGLANLGANMVTAAGQRTSFGTLQNPNFLGVFGAGLQQTEAQGRAASTQQADLASKNAQTLGQQLKNRLEQMQFPTEQAKQQYLRQYWQQILGAQPPPPVIVGDKQQPAVGGPFVAKNLPSWVTPDEDAVVRTVYGEARGESPEGQQAVASVIGNRAAKSGTSRSDVVYAKDQFEPWNDAKTRPMLENLDPNSPEYQAVFQNIQPILAGTGKDPTNGATYFYSPTAQAALGRETPQWAQNQTPQVIGRHNFYNLPFGNTATAANQPSPDAASQASPPAAPPANPIAARLLAQGQTPPYNIAGAMQPPPGQVAQAAPTQLGPTAQAPAAPARTPVTTATISAGNAAAQAEAAKMFATRDQMNQQAQQIEVAQKAWTVKQQFLSQQGVPMADPYPPGDPQTLRQQAAQYNAQAVQLQGGAAKAGTENVSIRGPGGAVVGPNGIIQAPDVYEAINPADGRKWRLTQNAIDDGRPYVRPPGVPDWAPPGTLTAVPAELSPAESEAMKEASSDAFGEKARAQYASAIGTKRSMEDMEAQIDFLNNTHGPGWYNTGAGGEAKLEIGKVANAALTSIGLPNWFDPQKLAAGEDLMKQTKLAGMTVLNQMQGAQREAAQIVISTQAAVPNIENTPVGDKLVLQSIKEAANWTTDMHSFMSNWYFAHNGNMIGADVAFSQQRPSQMYTRRGISMVRPFEVSSQKEFSRFLPGTQVYLKGTDPTNPANIKSVPGDEDLQFNGPPAVPQK